MPVASQQSCGARPFEKVIGTGEIVSCKGRPPVYCVDEIENGVVTGEVERPTRRGDDDRRTIPDQSQSEVSLTRDAVIMLRAVPLGRDVVHHSHTDVAHSVVASATCSATSAAGTPFAYCK